MFWLSYWCRFVHWLAREDIQKLEEDVVSLGETWFELVDKYEHLREFNAKRFRVGSIDVDPVGLTALARAIEPSMRVESDGQRLVIYSENPLDKPQLNAVVAHMRREVNLT